MKISFDLDDLLIPGSKRFETLKQSWVQRFFRLAKIRTGTKHLFKTLRANGHLIAIYTTSLRSITTIKFTFACYGIPIDDVINKQKHDKRLSKTDWKSSKYPPAFGIDIHIDDSPGVRIEGEKYNFRTVIIEEQDSNWVESVLDQI